MQEEEDRAFAVAFLKRKWYLGRGVILLCAKEVSFG